jgi:replicative DNA helicase
MQNQQSGHAACAAKMDAQRAHSEMAERVVLGGLLRKENTLPMLAVLMTEEDFYLHAHRLIFNQVLLLIKSSNRHDLMAVAETLEIGGELNKIGGLEYLNSLIAGLPSDADIQQCAVILRERLVSRSTPMQVDEDLQAWVALLSLQARERTQKNLLKITCAELSASVMGDSDATASELIDDAIAKLRQLKNRPNSRGER